MLGGVECAQQDQGPQKLACRAPRRQQDWRRCVAAACMVLQWAAMGGCRQAAGCCSPACGPPPFCKRGALAAVSRRALRGPCIMLMHGTCHLTMMQAGTHKGYTAVQAHTPVPRRCGVRGTRHAWVWRCWGACPTEEPSSTGIQLQQWQVATPDTPCSLWDGPSRGVCSRCAADEQPCWRRLPVPHHAAAQMKHAS